MPLRVGASVVHRSVVRGRRRPGYRHAARVSTRLDEFRPVPPVLPRTLNRADVGAAAWFGLLRDGVVRIVWGEVAIAADLADTPELRAVALAPLVPARGVVGRRAAAWVHTGSFPPVRVGRLRVTTVQRTGADLARMLPRDEAVPLLTALREVGFDPERALEQLSELRGQRGVRLARSTLQGL